MVSGLIPMRYARALYKYAAETDSCGKVYEDMKRMIASFEGNPDLEKVLSNPYVKTDDKKRLMVAAAGENPGDALTRFVALVIDHRREAFYYLMALSYRDLYRKENHISQVKITTAAELPDSEMEKLRAVVRNAFKDTVFEFEYAIDPDIIGGFIIDVDSVRMDASLSGELEQLRQNLLRSN